MKLKFDEDTHTYWVDGFQYPSVTQLFQQYHITRDYYRPGYDVLGRQVHTVCELYDMAEKYGYPFEEDISENIRPFLEAYVSCRQNHEIEITDIECYAISQTFKYAGRVDRIGEIKGEVAIMDIKSGSPSRNDPVQLFAYRMGIWEYRRSENVSEDILADLLTCKLANIYLNKDGSYKFKLYSNEELAEAGEIWNSILRLKAWKNR